MEYGKHKIRRETTLIMRQTGLKGRNSRIRRRDLIANFNIRTTFYCCEFITLCDVYFDSE